MKQIKKILIRFFIASCIFLSHVHIGDTHTIAHTLTPEQVRIYDM